MTKITFRYMIDERGYIEAGCESIITSFFPSTERENFPHLDPPEFYFRN